MTDPSPQRDGEPAAMVSVSRAIAVLHVICNAPTTGLRLRDISGALDLHKTSVSRLLGTLTALGVVERDRNRCYRVAEGFRTSLGVPPSTTRLRQAARPALGMLSDRLEDVSFLSIQSGLDSLCIARHVGTYPIQALSLNVGSRRPLGVGAGSLALLAWAPDGVREELLEAQRDRLGSYSATLDDIAAAMERARAQGFTDLPGFVIRGMTGMGMPVRDPSGMVVAALSVAAITDRLTGARRDLAIRTLRTEADRLEARLRSGDWGETASAPAAPAVKDGNDTDKGEKV